MKRFLAFLGLLALALVAMGVFATFRTPGHLWVSTRVFAGCPARPSCVSSKAVEDVHKIEPFSYTGDDVSVARARLEEVLAGLPDVRVEHSMPEYIHAVFLTPTVRFHDDVEFLFEGGVLQVRSISRFGYRDRGVNRARIEQLRKLWREKQ